MEAVESRAREAAPAADFWSVRAVSERSEVLGVRQDAAEPPLRSHDMGAMVTVVRGAAAGHAATSDLSTAGLRAAFGQAAALADASAGRCLPNHHAAAAHGASARYQSPHEKPLGTLSLAERYDLLHDVCARAAVGPQIVDRHATLWSIATEQLFVSSAGANLHHEWRHLIPGLVVVASEGGDTQQRSAGHRSGLSQQGGLEVLERGGFVENGAQVAREAIELVRAPNCPSGDMDVVLMPDQMMLQIHESIGHPLELDRILGDERNFAGTSFVTLDMFGSFRYGSDLLNVTHAPDIPEQFASFGHDDEGTPATREWLIRDGILLRPLGGTLSQLRARALRPDIEGVATARASAWNRAPIDRMSNLNIEPGSSTLDEMIAATDYGVLMRTNASWSIDDSRNKFQFGCEWGQVIRKGKLAEVVKRPNYRGISSRFWRSLAMVGDRSTFQVMGTPFCGKGEPSQVIRVGHASPACRFTGVSVFGGA